MAKVKAAQEGASAMAPAPEQDGSIFSRLYHGNTHFQFVGHRRRWYTFSAVVILIGLAALGIRGLNFGIEFKGGTSWEVTNTHLTVSQARNAVASTGVKQAVVVSLGSGSSTTIEVQADLSVYSAARKATLETDVTDALAAAAHVPANRVSLNDVGPTWGGQITTKAVQALIGFFVAILLYITLRFELKMAAAALVAVIHDILVTVGIYAIVGFEVTPATVIAVLTILGYSLYDTIVVFDRVQENVKGMVNSGRMTYSDAVDTSMNQVLMRSMNTSIVAIIPILSVLLIGAQLLGATTLQQFGLALFIGLTTGAYSSIFIASPLLAQLKEREPRYKALAERLAKAQAAEESKAAKRGARLAQQAGPKEGPAGGAEAASEPAATTDDALDGGSSGTAPQAERKRPKLVEPGQRSSSASRRRQGPKRR